MTPGVCPLQLCSQFAELKVSLYKEICYYGVQVVKKPPLLLWGAGCWSSPITGVQFVKHPHLLSSTPITMGCSLSSSPSLLVSIARRLKIWVCCINWPCWYCLGATTSLVPSVVSQVLHPQLLLFHLPLPQAALHMPFTTASSSVLPSHQNLDIHRTTLIRASTYAAHRLISH